MPILIFLLLTILIISPLLKRPLISVIPLGSKLLLFKIALLAPSSIVIVPDGCR